MYFIIQVNEDGESSCEALTKQQIEERLSEIDDYYGDDVKMFGSIPWDLDMASGPCGIVIIKGEIVVPKPRETVLKYEIV